MAKLDSTTIYGYLQINDDLLVERDAVIEGQLTINQASGTAPLVLTSTTKVNNLNADLLDDQHGSFYQNASNLNAGTLPIARIGTNSITLDKIQQINADTFLGRDTAGTGNIEVLTIPTVKTKLNLSGTNSGDQNIFQTVSVPNQSNIVASTTSDTLTLIAGSNVEITTNTTNKSVTINSSYVNTASAADGILQGSNIGTEIMYKPYETQQNTLSFDTSSTDPVRTDRLNLNGTLHATQLYEGSSRVLVRKTSDTTISTHKLAFFDVSTGDIVRSKLTFNDSGTTTDEIISAAQVNTRIDNAVSGVGSRLLAPVSDIPSLKALNTTNLEDKSLINVEDSGLYRFDKDSTVAGDDNRVVVPTTGPGRWFKMSSSINDHNNLSNIQGGTVNQYYHLTNSEYNNLHSPGSDNQTITSGNGMNFTSGSGNVTITLGTPSTITSTSTNSVTATSHTHAITGFSLSTHNHDSVYLKLTGGNLTGQLTATEYHITNADTYITSTEGKIAGNIIWHAGNDGAGTGLDADLLDGNHAAAFAAYNHTHGNISNLGAIGTTADLPLITTANGVVTTGLFGSAAKTFCEGNDPRLSDARTPVVHNNTYHSANYITSSGVTYENLNANGDVGTGSTQVARGNHTHTLNDLSDVSVNPSDGDTLVWNSLAGEWQASSSGTTISSLSDINDVLITDIASGEILVWNGTNWVNNTLTEAGIAAASHNHDSTYLGISAAAADSDKLDGQHGSFYQNASNLNAGTVPTARLTGTYGISISGNADTVDSMHATDFAPAAHTHASYVTGPASSTNGGVAVFDGTTGKVLKNGGFIPKAPLQSNLTVTVGTDGDFTTINAALHSVVSTYYPTFLSTGTVPRVTIQLLSGFIMAEQVLVESLDLSWITITGVDTQTTIDRSSLTTSFVSGFPAFGVRGGGFLPIINHLFTMNIILFNPERRGILVAENSRAIVCSGKGVTFSPTYGIYVEDSSVASVVGANFSNASTYGVYVRRGSIVSAYNVNGTLSQTANTVTADGIIFK